MLPNRVTHGMQVSVEPGIASARQDGVVVRDGVGVWEVLDRAPGGQNMWWLHRWTDGRWETAKLDAKEFEEVSPRIEWDATAPLNAKVRAGSYSSFHTDKGHKNVTGWIAGEYGTHNPGRGLLWSVTHIPTGLAVFQECYDMAEAKTLLAKLGELECLFPGLGFGDKPTDKAGLNTLKAIIKPELVGV